MTPRQLDRAVNAALGRILPPMVQALRDDLVTALREEFAARDEAPVCAETAKKAESFWPAHAVPWAPPHQLAPVPVSPALPEALPAPAAAKGPWTVGEGSRRRLTEAGLARLAELLPQKTDTEIAAELGITRRAVETRRKTGTESAAAWAATPQPERDLARAEKNRQYQREWYRKRRAKGGAPAEAEPVVIGVDLGSKPSVQVDVPVPSPTPASQTVVVVPAAEVPAPKQPPAPILPPSVTVMASKVPEVAARIAPPPPQPRPKAEPQVITTTPKEVRAWLVASMKAGGMSLVQAQDRVGFMTHDQALAEANLRRARAGHPPFAFIGARTAA